MIRAGDVVVCVNDRMDSSSTFQILRLFKGRHYRVARVTAHPDTGRPLLAPCGFETDGGGHIFFCIHRFRKVVPADKKFSGRIRQYEKA